MFSVLEIPLCEDSDMLLARQHGRLVASLAGLSNLDRAELVAGLTEVVKNLLQRRKEDGTVEYQVIDGEDGRQVLQLIIIEKGAAASYPEASVVKIKKLFDFVSVERNSNGCTTICLGKAIPPAIPIVTEKTVDQWRKFIAAEPPASTFDDLQKQNMQIMELLSEFHSPQNSLNKDHIQASKVQRELEETTARILTLYKEVDDKTKQLSESNKELTKALLELEQKKNELERSNDQIQEATKLKSEFLANMSHEIRTPINVIIGTTDILLRTTTDSSQQHLLDLIYDAGHSLLTLIGDILDLSKIEAGKMVIEFIDFDLVAAIEGTADLLSAAAQGKGLNLITFIDPQIPSNIFGDPGRLRQILLNLTNNALKFSEKGTVAIIVKLQQMEEDKVTLRFCVIDEGLGLTEEESSKLFQPFVQADGSTTRKYGGTGLGLSICKRLVELMGGTIGVDSVKGKGSNFWFTLSFSIRELSTSAQPRRFISKNTRALVVYENQLFCEAINSYLNFWGISSTSVSSGEEALKALQNESEKECPYQLVIIDMLMPQMTALQFWNTIKANSKLPKDTALIVSAYDKPGQRDELLAQGIKGYISKPLRQTQLFNCLANILDEPPILKSSMVNLPMISERTSQTVFADCGPILLAEDHPANQMIGRLQLKELGLSVDTVNNGLEALKAVASRDYALILMDCQMPEMDGFEATREIRRRETVTTRHTPIIAMTANAMAGDKEACLAAGMDDYMSKPVELKSLQLKLAKWLAREEMTLIQPSGQKHSRGNQVSTVDSESIDLQYLKNQYGQETLRELLLLFIPQTERLITELKTAVKNRDFSTIKATAHTLKGSSSNLHSNELTQLSRELERCDKDGDWKLISEKCDELEKAFARLSKCVDVFLKESILEDANTK